MSRRLHRFVVALAGLYLLPIVLTGQAPDPWAMLLLPRTHPPEPTSSAISPGDLKTRLYIFADDSMGGRLLDSPGNVMGTTYIARELARLRLTPGGDSGSYFQTLPLVDRVFDESIPLRVEGNRLTTWRDFVPRDQGAEARSIDGVPAVYGGTWGVPTSLLPEEAARGKLVVLSLAPAGYSANTPGTATRALVTRRFPGAAGIAVAGLDLISARILALYMEPAQEILGPESIEAPSFFYVTRRVQALLLGADSVAVGTLGHPVSGRIRFESVPIQYPARNVIGILPGSDPALRGQYLVLGAHNDHLGTVAKPVAHDSVYVLNHLFRPQGADEPPPALTPVQSTALNAALADIRARTRGASARPDSIRNGADDDGSGSVGLLEIAEYFAGATTRPRRSLIFIWHVGEEEGLYGSEYFSDHPAVPRDSIIGELNIDMIGRGGPTDITGVTRAGAMIHGDSDYVQLIGSRRLSTQLGDLAEEVNQATQRPLHFDYSLDAPGHPQQIYCRSDHWEYARYGIPIIFFTTGGHADYHQVTDEPQYIDYERLSRVTRFVATLAERLGDRDQRVVVDKEIPGRDASCRQ